MVEPSYKVAMNTIRIGKQGIVFNSSKSSSEKCAEDISKLVYFEGEKAPRAKIKNEPVPINQKFIYEKIANDVLKDVSQPTKQCLRLAKCIKKGIAFHHSGLTSGQKKIVEDNFRNGNIKIISSTTSLAAGLDMPAFRVILRSLRRFTGRGQDWIPVLEYLQMSGRAGRPGKEDKGESIAIANNEKDYNEIHDRFIYGKPEAIYSKLAVEPTLRIYILSLLSTGTVHDHKSLMNFFARTFWAFQFGDIHRLQVTIDKILMQLEEWEFIARKRDDFVSALDENNGDIEVTKLGRRVSQLYIDPLTANELLKSIEEIEKTEKKESITLLYIISNCLEMRPRLRVKNAEFDKIFTHFEANKENILGEFPDIYDEEFRECLEAFKTSLCLEEWIKESGENKILSEFDATPGDLKVKVDKSIWLLYCLSEISKIKNKKFIVKDLNKLSMRLKYGVKEELLPLLKLKQIGRVRARMMYNNGIKDIGNVKTCDIGLLSRLIGSKVAQNVKEQVGVKNQNASHSLSDF